MFIFKTIKIPHIIKKERRTRRGRVYYKKRGSLPLKKILTVGAAVWLIAMGARLLIFNEQNNGEYENLFADSFKIEEGAYTAHVLNEENINNISFDFQKDSSKAQVIIFQSHFSEEYNEEKEDGTKYTVADAGRRLAEILSDEYGLTVVHDMGQYDIYNGALDRENSYERSGEGVEKLMEKYPDAQIFIDVHRDAYNESENANYIEIDGKRCAYIMPVVGMCAIDNNGQMESAGVENDFLAENLKFAYDFRQACQSMADGLCKKIYLKPYRYSTYHGPMSILLEVGNEMNTFNEAENSLPYAAKAIAKTVGID